MRKPLAVLIQSHASLGYRYYIVVLKDGTVMTRLRVADCGYGAKLAYDEASLHYTLSSANWTRPLVARYRNLSLEEAWDGSAAPTLTQFDTSPASL